MNDIDNFNLLLTVLQGGEYRRKLPGRGITIIRHYEPFATVLARNFALAVSVMESTIIEFTKLLETGEFQKQVDEWKDHLDSIIEQRK